jgi:hypothetical protein
MDCITDSKKLSLSCFREYTNNITEETRTVDFPTFDHTVVFGKVVGRGGGGGGGGVTG